MKIYMFDSDRSKPENDYEIIFQREDNEKYKFRKLKYQSKKGEIPDIIQYKELYNAWWSETYVDLDAEKMPNVIFDNRNNFYFDDYALEKLKDLIDDKYEIFEATNGIKKYNYINFTYKVQNAIDIDKADIVWFDLEKKMGMRFKGNPSFIEETIKDKHLFKVQEVGGPTFVSEEFKKRCEESNITNAGFQLAWDSEGLPEDFLFPI